MASIHATKTNKAGRPARNTRWRARWRDANGRSRTSTFDRKIDAARFLDRQSADVQRGEWIDPRRASRSFDELADAWWKTTAKLAPLTRRSYHRLLEGHVRPYFGGKAQAAIEWLDVEEFIGEKLAKGYSSKMVRDMVSIVSLIMKLAVRGGVRKDNPAAGHSIPMRRKKVGAGEVLSMADAHRLVAATRDPYQPAVWLMLLAGLRPAELCGLRVRHVDAVRKELHVAETLNVVHGYDDQPYTVHRGLTKTAAGDRFLPLPQSICDDLAAMLSVRAENRGRAIHLDEPLFESIKGGAPLTVPALRLRVIRPALEAAGLPGSTRTYDLRHAHASLLIAEGANILEVAQRMGHTDPAVTLRVYGHLVPGAQQRLTDRLEQLRQAAAADVDKGQVISLDEHREASRA
jgi:integrase